MRRYAMVIEWSDEDQLFLVSIPDFPGAHTHGRTRAEAAAMGEEAIALLARRRSQPATGALYGDVDYPVRPEAEVRELTATGTSKVTTVLPSSARSACRVYHRLSTGHHPLPLMPETPHVRAA